MANEYSRAGHSTGNKNRSFKKSCRDRKKSKFLGVSGNHTRYSKKNMKCSVLQVLLAI